MNANVLPGRPYIKRTGMMDMPQLQADGTPFQCCAYTVSVMAADLSREAVMAENLDYDQAHDLVKRLEYRGVVEA